MLNEKNKSEAVDEKSLQQQIAELQVVLLQSEERFRSLTDSAPVGIFLDDADGRAVYINKKCEELLGVPAQDALDFDWIHYLHPEDRDEMVKTWKEAFQNNASFRLEYRWLHADGKVIWTLGEVIPILDDQGKVTQYIGTLTDITTRKQAEMEREALQKQLIQAQKMESIGRLAGGVAHDYNNMLNVILGYTEMAMAEVDSSGSVYQKLEQVLEAAERSRNVTRQLLTFARQQMVMPEVFDMNGAVEHMLKMLQRLIGEDIVLEWIPSPNPMLIQMDRSQFDHLVVNLCINARDAIDSVGKITLTAGLETLEETAFAVSGEFVRLSIRDTGIGMDPETLLNIFEPFFTTKGMNAGTGLGLASVYGTVQQSKGCIDVKSEPGSGTVFHIYLPHHTGPIPEKAPQNLSPTLRGNGEKILIVEDEVVILETLKVYLEKTGYKVLTADAPSKAINLVRNSGEDIDLVITDVIMPECNGKEMVQQMQEILPDIKYLYMSGYTADVIANRGIIEEQVHFIQKPFNSNAMSTKISEILTSGS